MTRPRDDSAGKMQQTLSANLRHACSHLGSIAAVCRALGLNRTQFNRYLNASARPSAHILNRLCDHFGVEADELYAPPEQFARILAVRRRAPAPQAPLLDMIDTLRGASLPALRAYAGYYEVHYASMSAPGRVIRGISHLFQHGADLYHRRIEHFPETGFKCRYAGTAVLLQDRIFIIDVETLTQNEITHTILLPSRRNRITRLSGLITGVSSDGARRVASARVVFDRLGERIDRRAALRRCAVLEPGDVPRDVREAISNAQAPNAPLFTAGSAL